ncbi:TadE/TadG family type IV pilus assembly protein [Pseudomonas bubulae]|uniref:TadE/TadG family type IV pilus assembly protein n=1 Tax=Pseudomonas bubulae TaxID=2316085 RepID=UPI001F22C82A|nr:TadE/TadG family type IV pilus assembly protein [Pseudomonas bubulae]MCF3193981.1 pilus assembly protein [Pseudomonas bubulae]
MNRKRMGGVYIVEFAITALVLFTLLFGALEMGRLYFTVNVLSESVRRGARLAAVCYIQDPIILRRAMFNTAGNTGPSSLIASLTSANLNLIYLDANGAVVSSPNDLVGASGFAAIRYVQLQVTNFSFNLLIPGFRGVFILPTFRSTVPRESLGRQPDPAVTPGITPC